MEEKQRNGAISAHIGHLERTSSDGLWHPGSDWGCRGNSEGIGSRSLRQTSHHSHIGSIVLDPPSTLIEVRNEMSGWHGGGRNESCKPLTLGVHIIGA